MSHHVSECHAALCDWAGLAEWQAALQAYLPTYRASSSAAAAASQLNMGCSTRVHRGGNRRRRGGPELIGRRSEHKL